MNPAPRALPLPPPTATVPSAASGRRRSAAVIGAGAAGLSTARRLVAAGWDVVLFEKSRGPGGRTATRRTDAGGAFDHGAPSFGAQSAPFQALLDQARSAGAVDLFVPTIADVGANGLVPRPAGPARWVGVPGMSALAGWLAQGLDVRCGQRVAAVSPSRAGSVLVMEDGTQTQTFDVVLVAVPGPQAVVLLSAAPALAARAATLAYAPCISLMLTLACPVARPFDALRFREGPLAWAVRGTGKPGRGPAERWVLYATAAWSAERLEQAPEAATPEMLAAFEHAVGALPAVAEVLPMRWRYARAIAGAAGPTALFDPHAGLGLAGDALAGHRVEDAFLSGLALAEAVLGLGASPHASDRA